jgi:glycosyltransferase involved in cell wall biosynthesis
MLSTVRLSNGRAAWRFFGQSGLVVILLIGKYPPIEGGVSAYNYWLAQAFAEAGHKVIVLTNAEEVEEEYRMRLTAGDRAKLRGFRKRGSILVSSTRWDSKVSYVPWANPYLSKLVSLGLELVARHRPRFAYCSYFEPYGVAGLMLSKLTGIPYLVQHAGSDLGRLSASRQLRALHREMLRGAAGVVCSPPAERRLIALGASQKRLLRPLDCRLPPDVFRPSRLGRKAGAPLRLISYGKLDPSKGIDPLLKALAECRGGGLSITIDAFWGGPSLEGIKRAISRLGLGKAVRLHGFVPPWRIALAIRRAHVGVFLESGFPIAMHTPLGAIECMACGRPVILSEELARKAHMAGLVLRGRTAFVVRGSRPGPKGIERAFREAFAAAHSQLRIVLNREPGGDRRLRRQMRFLIGRATGPIGLQKADRNRLL